MCCAALHPLRGVVASYVGRPRSPQRPTVHCRGQDWKPALASSFVESVAERCIGYCGADLKALCTETALRALRRQYPEIYTSAEKLQIETSRINVAAVDFADAMKAITPASQRSVKPAGRRLPAETAPLLEEDLRRALGQLSRLMPDAYETRRTYGSAERLQFGLPPSPPRAWPILQPASPFA